LQAAGIVDDHRAFGEAQPYRVEAQPCVVAGLTAQRQPAQCRRRQRRRKTASCGEVGGGVGRGQVSQAPAPEQGREGGQGQVEGEVRERLARPDQARHDERQHGRMLTRSVSSK
jgi:hypothetical protein